VSADQCSVSCRANCTVANFCLLLLEDGVTSTRAYIGNDETSLGCYASVCVCVCGGGEGLQ
jgi:hypothetical protein